MKLRPMLNLSATRDDESPEDNPNAINTDSNDMSSGTSSEEAKISKGKVYSILSDEKPVLKYEEPSFKVKVGKFYSRLEAQKTFAQLKRKFPNAIIIPERIQLSEID